MPVSESPTAKPVKKHHREPCYDYLEIIDYVERKYGVDTRGYKREVDGEYRDFWRWVHDNNSIHNGCYASFPECWDAEDDDDYDNPWWAREILRLIVDEFYPDGGDMTFYVAW